jgi:hypothetical protein
VVLGHLNSVVSVVTAPIYNTWEFRRLPELLVKKILLQQIPTISELFYKFGAGQCAGTLCPASFKLQDDKHYLLKMIASDKRQWEAFERRLRTTEVSLRTYAWKFDDPNPGTITCRSVSEDGVKETGG